MNQDATFEELISELLSQVRAYGIKEVSVLEYKSVCRKLMKFISKKGEDTGRCSADLLEQYLEFEERRCSQGEICPDFLRFIKRVIRMLRILAETGTVDFSTSNSTKKYTVCDEALQLTGEILDYYGLSGEPRSEMDRVMRHLFCYAQQRGFGVSDITDEILMNFFMEELPKTNRGSMGRSLRAVKFVSDYMQTHGLGYLTLDFSQLKARSSHVRVIQPYSSNEVRAILESIDTDTELGMRDYAVILLAYETGLRGVDIRTLKLSDIDWKHGKIRIRQNKTAEPVILPLTGRAMNVLADYILQFRPECGLDEVFLTVRGPVKPMNKRHHSFTVMTEKYEECAGVEKIEGRSFHSFRRAFATDLSEAGVSIEMISQLLGHRRIEEDKPYLSYNREQAAFCALGFEGIAVKSGVYKDVFTADQKKGGEENDLS